MELVNSSVGTVSDKGGGSKDLCSSRAVVYGNIASPLPAKIASPFRSADSPKTAANNICATNVYNRLGNTLQKSPNIFSLLDPYSTDCITSEEQIGRTHLRTNHRHTWDICKNLDSINMNDEVPPVLIGEELPIKRIKSFPKVFHRNRSEEMTTRFPNYFSDKKYPFGMFKIEPYHFLPFISKYIISANVKKQELLDKISKKDREIAETENEINKLKNKLTVVSVKQNQFSKGLEIVPKGSSFARIYAENKKKAGQSHRKLEHLSTRLVDVSNIEAIKGAVFMKNKKKDVHFRPVLIKYLRKQRKEELENAKLMSEFYSLKLEAWLKAMDDIESSEEWAKRETDKLDFFESVFPELRFERETKENFRSQTVRTRSTLQQRDFITFIKEKRSADSRMHSYAACIPRLLTRKERSYQFINKNGFEQDAKAVYNQRKSLYQMKWGDSEKEVFRERFLESPKNFSYIAMNLNGKTTAESIHFYYVNKKTENYKQLLYLKQGPKLRSRSQRVRSADGTGNSELQADSVEAQDLAQDKKLATRM